MYARFITRLKLIFVGLIWFTGAFPQEAAPTLIMVKTSLGPIASFSIVFISICILYLIQYSLLTSLFKQEVTHHFFIWIQERAKTAHTPLLLPGVVFVSRLVKNFDSMLNKFHPLKRHAFIALFGLLPLGLTSFALINLARIRYLRGVLFLLIGVACNIILATFIGYLGIHYTTPALFVAGIIMFWVLYHQKNKTG